MKTVIVHRTPVALPAHAFTARHQDRHTLSGRRLVRMPVGPAIAARRALSAQPVALQPALEPSWPTVAPRQWPWTLATLALLIAVVAACGWSL